MSFGWIPHGGVRSAAGAVLERHQTAPPPIILRSTATAIMRKAEKRKRPSTPSSSTRRSALDELKDKWAGRSVLIVGDGDFSFRREPSYSHHDEDEAQQHNDSAHSFLWHTCNLCRCIHHETNPVTVRVCVVSLCELCAGQCGIGAPRHGSTRGRHFV